VSGVFRERSRAGRRAGSVTWVAAGHTVSGSVELKTTFVVVLMKSANGCIDEVGQ